MFVDQSQLLEFIPDTWMRTTPKIMMAMDTISMAAGSSSSAPKRRRSLAPSCNATSARKMAYNDLVDKVLQLAAKIEDGDKGGRGVSVSNLMIQAGLYHTNLS